MGNRFVTVLSLVAALGVSPAFAQSAGGLGMGASPLIPGGARSLPAANEPANGAGGLCQCLPPPGGRSPFENTDLRISCRGTLYACQSGCNTNITFSYIPDARYSCPARPADEASRVAGLR